MISGLVTAEAEAVIELAVFGIHGQQHVLQAIIDTGFTGWLTLPASLVAALGLSWRRRARVMLADGTGRALDMYDGTINWDGQPKRVWISATESRLLVGMSLLRGHELTIQVIPGGSVHILAL